MGGHSRKRKKGSFCAVAAQPCECGNDYIEGCRPSWGDTSVFQYAWRIGRTKFKVTKIFEAHHLLCVASIGKIVVGDSRIGQVVGETEWCVNDAHNMLAMPMWGHTVKWYCEAGTTRAFKAAPTPPPFANIPQHDWDHNGDGGYIEGLETQLRDIMSGAAEAAKDHTLDPPDLAGDLNDLATHFRDELKARGLRSGGTAAGWAMGRASLGSTDAPAAPTTTGGVLAGRWYYPFSMASDGGVTAKGYPALSFDEQTQYKLEWLAKKLQGLGSL